MKSNIHKVNYDGSSNINGHWIVWKEKCDRCGNFDIYENKKENNEV